MSVGGGPVRGGSSGQGLLLGAGLAAAADGRGRGLGRRRQWPPAAVARENAFFERDLPREGDTSQTPKNKNTNDHSNNTRQTTRQRGRFKDEAGTRTQQR
jgi:hypothetical protein